MLSKGLLENAADRPKITRTAFTLEKSAPRLDFVNASNSMTLSDVSPTGTFNVNDEALTVSEKTMKSTPSVDPGFCSEKVNLV